MSGASGVEEARNAVLLAWVRSSPGHPLSARHEAARRALATDWPELYGALAALERAAQVAGAELALADVAAGSPWATFPCERHPAGHGTAGAVRRCKLDSDARAIAQASVDTP